MSDDICDRLVRFSWDKQCMSTDLEVEAAAEITRLREENTRLREALKGVIRIADRNTIEFDAARAAIREGGEDRYARG